MTRPTPRTSAKRRLLLAGATFALLVLTPDASAEIQVINGVRYECADGLCRRIDAPSDEASAEPAEPTASAGNAARGEGRRPARLAQGYMDADAFLAFLRGDAASSAPLPASPALLLLALLVAGVAMNLTPCVLPMVPVNLIVIGRSPQRGLLYGLGIALAYGTLGVLAAVGGLAFGTIQSHPLFNAFVALVFVALGLSLCGVFALDLTRWRSRRGLSADGRAGVLFPLFMGALAAVLAGACVAPVLVSALVLTANLYAQGVVWALALPFALGLGMALPWPFLGAGLKVLPKPGVWMRWVNRAFAVLVFAFALWYARLAVLGFFARAASPEIAVSADAARLEATPATFGATLATLGDAGKPVLVDCWATWCKNCTAMEQGTLREPRVVEALKGFSVVRLQAEDLAELKRLPGFADVQGLPAFVLFEASRR